ncbi:hypothetical protein SAMN04515667_0792 [Formosa sp. Hel1_31_208]|uniref:hypothetical protein n=1 Tax=Formosa sp. Hel1_31_208 TaxID=1798225 RepID=UPI00087BD428|nr:hypothetical protein [Formosa sp. Hel1_31_208]SDR83495.1 hypothetical protein SAMN04515667_0792 [Formosa sp. Hel1_31_208]
MTNPVKLSDAKAWTLKWQNDNPNHAKAFLIPVADLLMCMTEMGLTISRDKNGNLVADDPNAQVRTYMGADESQSEGFGEKLVIVGTVKNGAIQSDIVENGSFPTDGGAKLIGSGAFDFTKPCPSNCDPKSPLNH